MRAGPQIFGGLERNRDVPIEVQQHIAAINTNVSATPWCNRFIFFVALSPISPSQLRGVHAALQMPTYSAMIEAPDYIRALCQSIKRARLDDNDRDIKLVLLEIYVPDVRAMLETRHDRTELITTSARRLSMTTARQFRSKCPHSNRLRNCCIMDDGSSRGSHRSGQGFRIVDALAKEMNERIDHRFGAGGIPINSGAPQGIDDTWISAGDPIIEMPVAARIAPGSITVMNAEVVSHEP
jgi:hypothetical protein